MALKNTFYAIHINIRKKGCKNVGNPTFFTTFFKFSKILSGFGISFRGYI